MSKDPKEMNPTELREHFVKLSKEFDEQAKTVEPMTPEQDARYKELVACVARPVTDLKCKGGSEENRFDEATVEKIKQGYPEATRVVELGELFIVEGVEGFFQSEAEIDEYKALVRHTMLLKRRAVLEGRY